MVSIVGGMSLDILRCLVNDLGLDVNQAAFDGENYLCVPAKHGRLSVIRCLVEEFGADVNQSRSSGATP
jgi:hypothetical protein